MKNEQKTKNSTKKIIKFSDISYYSQNFKFYFTWFCIAIWIFIILFVLWIININKTPQLLNNPKTLNYVKNNAFWEINSWNENNETNKPKNSIISWYPILYHIWEKQIPNLDKNYYIIKDSETDEISINPLIKYLRIPEIKTKAFKEWNIENLLFKTGNNKYYISIDFNHNKIEVFNTENYYPENNKEFTEKEIKKYIKSEIEDLWLTLKYYDNPIIIDDNGNELILFYTRIIDDKEVWNSEIQKEWLSITFDKTKWIITNIYNYDTQSYLLSKYPFNKTKKELLESLQKRWNIDTTKKWQEWSIPMEKWKEIYLKQWEYIVPALLFKSNTNMEKNIILPLY